MMTRLALVALLAAAIFPAQARTAADFLVELPTEECVLLEPGMRLDMIDYFQAGQSTPVRNVLGEPSRILSATPERVVVEISENSTLEVAVIPAGRDTVVAVVKTVKVPMADSRIAFFRPDTWTKTIGPMPGLSDFASSRSDAAEAQAIPMAFVSATYDPDSGQFVFSNNTAAYYHSTEIPPVLARLTPELKLKWNGRKWTR